MKNSSWKETLREKMPEQYAHEIDVFEGQMELMKQEKLDEKVFAETRLRRGAYGQRYDNGQRYDGIRDQQLDYPQKVKKGTDTEWDAPGMQRIKIPYGGMNVEQMEALAQVADEYADGVLHVTTRQDIQLHFVHIEDTPDMMRRLAAVGITTREACGNSVRNITGCPLAGVCKTEAFDVTPYSDAMTWFLLGHDDVQDFGRKFKIAFSGCEHEACGLVRLHDLGLVAKVQEDQSGNRVRGFAIYVGGGLGTIPHQAKVLYDFVTEEEILPISQAIARVFARLGEKKNRNRARIKFLVAKLGIDEFRKLVDAERKVLPHDDRWTSYLKDIDKFEEEPVRLPAFLNGQYRPDGFDEWFSTNVYHQRQEGYSVVTINLPLGDITTRQMFQLADIARKYVGDAVRTTVEQNLVLRWVSEVDLPDLFSELKEAGLADPGAGTLVDITSCPGTDTCKLGISSSRGLAGELTERLIAKKESLPQKVRDLKIKISGCFNSCGQHHVSDIGFYGNSRKVGNHRMPHFQVVLGGQWENNAGSYGMAIGAVPSKAVPRVLEAITERYMKERKDEEDESFQEWSGRLGKREAREMIRPYMETPDFQENPDYFTDWGDPRLYTMNDMGIGECAGEMVSLFSIEISKAESEAFEAQVSLEEKEYKQAYDQAFSAMILAARSLVRTQFPDVGDEADRIVKEFKTRFFDTELFFDTYAKGKFGRYLFDRHEEADPNPDEDKAHQIVEEAQLFIEASHTCEMKMSEAVPSDS
ncbi:MAG: nitrite/sulfite reductase [Balneolaceae bacterium]